MCAGGVEGSVCIAMGLRCGVEGSLCIAMGVEVCKAMGVRWGC